MGLILLKHLTMTDACNPNQELVNALVSSLCLDKFCLTADTLLPKNSNVTTAIKQAS